MREGGGERKWNGREKRRKKKGKEVGGRGVGDRSKGFGRGK